MNFKVQKWVTEEVPFEELDLAYWLDTNLKLTTPCPHSFIGRSPKPWSKVLEELDQFGLKVVPKDD